MGRKLAEYGVFLKEVLRHNHSTGAVLPSGRALCQALSRNVRNGQDGRTILEVGPGTGAVTQRIVQSMAPQDEFHLVELNEGFVQHLRQRFASEPTFQAVSQRSHIIHGPLEELPLDQSFDLIVSCLPLNNFPVELVEQILALLARLLKPGGTLSFFEYMAVRPLRSAISGREERARIRGVGRAVDGLVERHAVACDWVWLNVPPAWVHHLQFQPAPVTTTSV